MKKTARAVLEWKPTRKRPRRRPRKRLIDIVDEDHKKIEVLEWRTKVHKREKWRQVVNSYRVVNTSRRLIQSRIHFLFRVFCTSKINRYAHSAHIWRIIRLKVVWRDSLDKILRLIIAYNSYNSLLSTFYSPVCNKLVEANRCREKSQLVVTATKIVSCDKGYRHRGHGGGWRDDLPLGIFFCVFLCASLSFLW